MKTLAMLGGSFLFTFCVLALAWLTLVGAGQPRLSADPSSATSAPTLTPPPSTPDSTATPGHQPTAKPAKPTPTVQASAPSAAPGARATPSLGPLTSQTYVLVGGAYTSIEIPDGGSITPSGDGVALATDAGASDPLRVTYVLAQSELPAGARVATVAVRVCGEATGTNYEIDGPQGLSQSIRVGIPPEGDGCWHLDAEAPTELSVTVSASMGTHLLIRSVEYTVAIAR